VLAAAIAYGALPVPLCSRCAGFLKRSGLVRPDRISLGIGALPHECLQTWWMQEPGPSNSIRALLSDRTPVHSGTRTRGEDMGRGGRPVPAASSKKHGSMADTWA
jgi:hypothetical protein